MPNYLPQPVTPTRYSTSSAGAAPLVAQVAGAYDVADLSIQEPDIEDVIRELYQRGRG